MMNLPNWKSANNSDDDDDDNLFKNLSNHSYNNQNNFNNINHPVSKSDVNKSIRYLNTPSPIQNIETDSQIPKHINNNNINSYFRNRQTPIRVIDKSIDKSGSKSVDTQRQSNDINSIKIDSNTHLKENYHSKINDINISSNNNSSDNLFVFREFLLQSSESIRLINSFISKVYDLILNDGEIDDKAIYSLYSTIYSRSIKETFIASVSNIPKGLPKEAYMLYDNKNELDKNIKDMIISFVECYNTRKSFYLNQLQKIRDNTNVTIRQSIQSEKEESMKNISKMKEFYESKRTTQTIDLQKDLEICNKQRKQLEIQLSEARDTISQLQYINNNHNEDIKKRIASVIQERQIEFDREKDRLLDSYKLDVNRIREEAEMHIANATKGLQIQIESQHKHDDEMKSILSNERIRLESETIKLRDQIVDLMTQLSMEKEKSNLRIKDEQRKHERDLHYEQSQHIQSQAKLKSDMQEIIQYYKNLEAKLKDEMNTSIAREKARQLSDFNVQLEKRDDLYKQDLKKFKSTIEQRHVEEIQKLNTLHEQEMKNVIRENGRYQKLIARSGIKVDGFSNMSLNQSTLSSTTNASKFYNPLNSSVSSLINRSYSNINNNYNNKSNTDYLSKIDEEDSLDIPSYVSNSNQSIEDNKEDTRKWGKLQDSLDYQERSGIDRINESVLSTNNNNDNNLTGLPDTFMLDEAYELVKNNNANVNASLTAQKVGTYMSQLQEYLEVKAS